MIKLHFYKFHGAGNDFIIVDNRAGNISGKELSASQIGHLCHRRFGIGADGFILLNPATKNTDFSMQYFNSDGFEGSLCGNGSRCVVAFACFLKIIDRSCTFEAADGIHQARILSSGDGEWVVSLQMNDVSQVTVLQDGYFIDTGSPHFVMFVEDSDNVDVIGLGKQYRYDARFLQGTNVNFVSQCEDGIFVRTYERGVEDETFSCGTGVTASALAWAVFKGFRDDRYELPVSAKGGNFTVSFRKNQNHYAEIYLTGPAKLSFEGDIILPAITGEK